MALWILLCLAIITLQSEARPYLMLTSKNPKCVFVEVPESSTIQVQIDAPDLDDSESSSITVSQPGISNPKVRNIDDKYTTIDFTAYESGAVEACITAESASKKNMLRFGIDIVEVEVLEDDTLTKEQENLHHELSQVEHMLIKFRMDMHSIQMEADYEKEREEIFFKEMISMHQESGWWPILHVMVLIGAGFMQAQHIVSFFKKKHLI